MYTIKNIDFFAVHTSNVKNKFTQASAQICDFGATRREVKFAIEGAGKDLKEYEKDKTDDWKEILQSYCRKPGV